MVSAWKVPTYGSPIGAFYYLQSKKDSLPDFRYPSSDDMDVLSRARIKQLNYICVRCDKSKPQRYIGYRFCMNDHGSRLRLDSVMVQDDAVHYSSTTGIKGVYRFKYNRFDELPSDYLTSCVDHWGYYNGKPYKRADWKYEKNLETFRDPNFSYTTVGILNEIIYPTGGLTNFEYEANTYSKKLSNDRQSISEATGVGGGLRIKSIKSYDSSDKRQLLSEKDYSYNIPNTNRSSGELFASPLYYWKDWSLKCESKNASYHMSTFHTSSIVPLANSSGVSLGYSYVTETVKDNTEPNKILEKHVYSYSNLSDPSVRDQRLHLPSDMPISSHPLTNGLNWGSKEGAFSTRRFTTVTEEKLKALDASIARTTI